MANENKPCGCKAKAARKRATRRIINIAWGTGVIGLLAYVAFFK